MEIPTYEEVHVISDLHMGGKIGFQILKETKRLANYIRWVSIQKPDDRVALILNGDVIDTLAEDFEGYIAIDNAVTVVKRIMDDESFQDVWTALAEFVKTPKRTLVIIIGNHDIELAFPTVQWAILERLTSDDLNAKARIEFSVSGAGYPCMVGKARVFCTHGNEVDPWNFVRYENLSKAARRINTNRPISTSEWIPNAGTKLVKDVMNEVKRKYAWIDLLKPETKAAIGVLLALDPSQITKLYNIIPLVGKMVLEKSQVDKRLSADIFEVKNTNSTESSTLDQMLGSNLLDGLYPKHSDTQQLVDDMLLNAENNYRSGNLNLGKEQNPARLGFGQMIFDKLADVSNSDVLRRALLDWLKNDQTFNMNFEDDTFKDVTQSLGSNIDFVVTGHTHLERAIEYDGGNRYYFNCGTWIRLLGFTEENLKEGSFESYYKVLQNGSMNNIDQNSPSGFVLDKTSAIRIRVLNNDTVIGELGHVIDDANSIFFDSQKKFERILK